MANHKHEFPILKMSQVFNVSASGYYKWLSRPSGKRARENVKLREAIHAIWERSGSIYGSPRVHQGLRKAGWRVSRPRVARLMQKMGIASRLRRKWVTTTDSNHTYPTAPNLLERRFNPSRLNQVWVSDITFLPSQQGWLYLTTFMDLADRQILGWALSRTMSAQQTSMAAFKQAQARRPVCKGLLVHSDRGSQYACTDFVELLKKHQLLQSMARKGNCWDNAPAESFFKTLKAELLPATGAFRDYEHARASVFQYIEVWYNRQRLHSSLGYKTPMQAEKEFKL